MRAMDAWFTGKLQLLAGTGDAGTDGRRWTGVNGTDGCVDSWTIVDGMGAENTRDMTGSDGGGPASIGIVGISGCGMGE